MTRDVYVVDTRRSLYAKLIPVPLNRVVVRDRFWRLKLDTLVDRTLPSQHMVIEETGRVDNFRVAGGLKAGFHVGMWYNDSDVYKWVEASSYALVYKWSDELYNRLRDVIDAIISAQEPDGYINTYVQIKRLRRWVNLAWSHELYCGGHLIQAAIATRRALRDEKLFTAAVKFADLVSETFGFEEGKLKLSDGHPEIELALVELYRETATRKYLDLSSFFVRVRGEELISRANEYGHVLYVPPVHILDHVPITKLEDPVGVHAVRALYFFAGVTDLYIETGDQELWAAVKRLWSSVLRKMYITGGLGSRYDGESFGEDFELPNDRAYCETCASVAGVLWAWRMFLATGESEYMDVLERILYNAAIAGISFDGTKYFYVNPLADYYGKHERQPWFDTACCPTNIIRLLAYMPSMIYSTSRSEAQLWINLFVKSTSDIDLHGNRVKVDVETDYPWTGRALIKLSPNTVDEFSVMIRIPSWASSARVKVREEVVNPRPGEYFEVRKVWDVNDTIEVDISIKPTLVASNPLVEANWGRVAITRGPLVYCIEQVDNQDFDINKLVVDPDSVNLRERFEPDLFNGIVVVEGEGYVLQDRVDVGAYQVYDKKRFEVSRRVLFRAIPYHLWNNRGRSKMQVWIKTLPLGGLNEAGSSTLKSLNSSRIYEAERGVHGDRSD